ncbi:non-homologous end-joining DNA ligase [Candidatus Contubernalis alkaliaceticus]|uniref:non-homologous end-joining DNA ligase n=1 Tax=Candidatus Contubernalis alkaliaceticus TaxID=338645 RepID=UPI001F4C12C9|nr:non-homologous end-joining DNA ligase [Candidatus Contubernalis alkalaceticus]UNC93390.1 DNA ligase [Candidatus Contubernalis alkalaceticus]
MERDLLEEKIKPMEPHSRKDIPLGRQYLYQVKWDGVRMLAFISEGKVRLQNRRLKDRTLQYPEAIQLPSQVKFAKGVLDGEMVVLRQGKPSFPSILKRDLLTRLERLQTLTHTLPAVYYIFDLLYIEGKPLFSCPYEERQRLLRESVQESDFIKITDNSQEGEKLFAWAKENGLEGVVAKVKDSPYVSGKNSHHWWKIKVKHKIMCTIGGFTVKDGRISSLMAGAYLGQELLYVGRVGTGLKEDEWRNLMGYLMERQISESPFTNLPSSQSSIWVQPSLAMWVEFSEWTPQLKLRAPSIKGFTTADPEECTLP